MKSITLLTGKNEVFRREHLEKMLKNVPKDEITVYYADEAEPAVIFAQCYQNSLFGSSNVVIIRVSEDLKGKTQDGGNRKDEFQNQLLRYIEHFNSDTRLIIEWEDPPDKVKKALEKSDGFEVKSFKPVYRNEIAPFVRNKFQESGIRIEEGVADLLTDLANDDLSQIEMFIRVLKDYAGQNDRLTVEDTRSALSRSGNLGEYDFIEAFFSNQPRKSLYALNDLRRVGQPVILLNNLILRTATQLWGYLTMKDHPNLADLLGIRAFQLKYLREYARTSDLKFVSAVFDLIKRVEEKSKSMPEEFAFLEIEQFITGMAGA